MRSIFIVTTVVFGISRFLFSMDSPSLTMEQQQVVASTYKAPLSALTETIVEGRTLSNEQIYAGLELVNSYYAYLESCGIPYGTTALAVINKKGFVGQMTDTHFERQLQFEGISGIESIKPILKISLAQRDAELRISQNVSSKDIASYHIQVYEKLKLPVYAWSGLFITKVCGDNVWDAALANENIFTDVVKNSLSVAGNLSQDRIDNFSVARMRSSFIDAIECSTPGLKSFCSPAFSVGEISLDPNPYETLAKKWAVDKSQVVKANPETKLMNRDLYFIKDHEYLIISKPEAQLKKVLLIKQILHAVQTRQERIITHLNGLQIAAKFRQGNLLKGLAEIDVADLIRQKEQSTASANAKLADAFQRAMAQADAESKIEKAFADAHNKGGNNKKINDRYRLAYEQECQQIEAEYQSKQAEINNKLAVTTQLQILSQNHVHNKSEVDKALLTISGLVDQSIKDINEDKDFDIEAFIKTIERECANAIDRLKVP